MKDHAFVISCNPAYAYGMIATMNAQEHFGTDADWEIAYEDFTKQDMALIGSAYKNKVSWTPISELMEDVVDNREPVFAKTYPLQRFWLSYWLLAKKLLKEKKYKSVCVIQADEFCFVNLDVYFKMADNGIFVSTQYPFNTLNASELPFGDDHAITGRYNMPLFDAINFLGKNHIGIADDAVKFQCEDPYKEESNFSVVALNRAACKHSSRDSILGLPGETWVCDSLWGRENFRAWNDKILTGESLQINAIHHRWWDEGRVTAELKSQEINPIMHRKVRNNIYAVRDFMHRFYMMKPQLTEIATVHV